MNELEFKNLLEKYSQGKCTISEKEQLESWLTFGEFFGRTLSEEELDAHLDKLAKRLPFHQKSNKLWPSWVAAASIIILTSIGLYFYPTKTPKNVKPSAEMIVKDIQPGKFGATLTLAGGKKIRLSDVQSGKLASEAGVLITKTTDGQLIYEIKGSDDKSNTVHTLSTAKGETYQLRLPDGSIAYLNAASSLTYGASLIENGKRIVTLKGEGYFEIAKDKKHPFIIKTGNHNVEVLGTSFNIMAYTGEPTIKTTLIEGSVKVSSDRTSGILSQGEESSFNGKIFEIEKVNVEDAIAWKNGYFLFNNNTVEMAMRKIALWYDVEVKYHNSMRQSYVGGRISRKKTLREVIQILELTKKVKIKLEGRVLTIMP